jgi:hypothetical protein
VPFPELFRAFVVVAQCEIGESSQVLLIQFQFDLRRYPLTCIVTACEAFVGSPFRCVTAVWPHPSRNLDQTQWT